jgi:hypothetical protein
MQELLVLNPVKTGFGASTVVIANGIVTPAPTLTRQLTGANIYIRPVLSPSAKWLLTQQRVNGWDIPVALSVDGGRRASWPQDSPTKLFPKIPEQLPMWLADNSHWLEFNALDRDVRIWTVRHGIGVPDKNLGKWDLFGLIVGQDEKGRLLEYEMEVTTAIKHRLIAHDPTSGAQTGETVLPVSFDISLTQMSLSPGGDRVAFVSITGDEPLYPQWIVNHIPSLRKYRKPFKFALWICGVDGKGLEELGCSVANVHPRQHLYANENLGNLSWLPDGRSLSFVLDGKLWVTPAD